MNEVLGYEYPQGQSALDLEDVEDAIGRLVDGSAKPPTAYSLMLHGHLNSESGNRCAGNSVLGTHSPVS